MEAKRTEHDHGTSLPEDIIFDVLARLPAKTLCRLRCVCKWWHALISDPAFVAAQKSRAADPHLVCVFMGPRYVPEVRVMDMDGNVVRSFKIMRCTPLPAQLHTWKDLICSDGRAGMRPLGGIIIDPAAVEAYDVFGTSYLGHWVMSSSIILGRATPSGDFKILRLEDPFLLDDHGHAGSGHQLCKVATIMDRSGGVTAETLTWRRKSAPPFVTRIVPEHRAIVNGIVYFIQEVETDGVRYCVPNVNCIVAFDLESEEWKAEAIIKGPTLGHKKEREIWSIALVELKGTLALVHDVVRVKECTYSSIWFLIYQVNSVWVKEYMIPIPNNQIVTTKPLGVLVDGRILLWSSVPQEDETRQDKISFSRYRKVVLFYDPSTKAFTDFMEIEGFMRYPIVVYTGSLLA